jgi:hypothetical protein
MFLGKIEAVEVVVLWWLSGTLLLSGKSNPNNTGGCIY